MVKDNVRFRRRFIANHQTIGLRLTGDRTRELTARLVVAFHCHVMETNTRRLIRDQDTNADEQWHLTQEHKTTYARRDGGERTGFHLDLMSGSPAPSDRTRERVTTAPRGLRSQELAIVAD